MKYLLLGMIAGVLGFFGLSSSAVAQMQVVSGDVEVTSGDKAYPSYRAAPDSGGPYPGIILLHSFGGLEQGYRTLSDRLAAEGFVVLAVGWQSFAQDPGDEVVKQLVEDSIAFLTAQGDVDTERIGLTGFCAGGRYTMLYLPQIKSIHAGVAWYGFPDRGDPAPIALVEQLTTPMLIIHGTADQASPIARVYNYAQTLTAAKAYFELKVYYGKPHGFMLTNGELSTDEVAQDAFREMVNFFKRKLA